jgi:DNA-binding NarL/FixJ family response regulator
VRVDPGRAGAHIPRAVAVVAEDAVGARRLFLELQSAGFVLVGRFTSVKELLLEQCARAPDALVLACDRLDTLRADDVRALREAWPEAVFVMVAPYSTRRAVHDALDAGADGFVVDDRVRGALGAAVAAVFAGHVVLPREWRERVAKPVLTPREKQVLGMVVLGLTNNEVARKLFVAESTVKSHLTSIFAKLDVRGRNEATALVLDPESGLGSLVLR